jgi:hypothetical protein
MNFGDALRLLEPAAEITALGTVRGLDTDRPVTSPTSACNPADDALWETCYKL